MNDQQFDNENDYQVFLQKRWAEESKVLSSRHGQEYYDEVVVAISDLFAADRVYIASYDLALKFGSTIADFYLEQLQDSYEFHVPGTPVEDIANGKSVLIEDGLAEFYSSDENLLGYRAMVGRPAYDDDDNIIGLIVLLFERELRWSESVYAILGLGIGRIGSEMVSFYKGRTLNDLNHQLRRELASSNQLKEELSRLAYIDRVTGLPNREQFMVDVGMYSDLSGYWLALCGVDCFKPVNESLGLDSGDLLLREIGRCLSNIDEIDTRVYKWTGDEFMMFGFAGHGRSDIEEKIRLIDHVFHEPMIIKMSQVHVTRSTGITSLEDPAEINGAIKSVCVAMQRAKLRGGNRAVFYRESMNTDETQFFRVHSLMQQAITKQQFIPHYQPIYDPLSEEYVGFEALMRWIDTGGEHVFYPNQFIPIAERSGLIVEMGKEIIAIAIRNLSEWNARYKVERDLSINLSPLQFHDDSLVCHIEKITRRYGVNPSLIKFEITESLFVQEGEYVLDKLKELKSIGFLLSLDDFGTGYSSLSYLQKYPFDVIKVDKCFVDHVVESHKSKALIKAIRLLAGELGMKLVAEGVETEEQVNCLTMLGVDYLQGYYYSKPKSAQEIDIFYQGNVSLGVGPVIKDGGLSLR